MKDWRLREVLFLCIVVAASCPAIGIRNLKIDELVKASDVIAVADVVRVDEVGSVPDVMFGTHDLRAYGYRAELVVRNSIKGSISGRVSVRYSLPISFIGYQSLRVGTRLVFLRKNGSNYSVADPYYPDLPAVVSSSQNYALNESGSYARSVVREMLDVVASDSTSSAEKSEILRVAYALPINEEVIAAFRKGVSRANDTDLQQRIQGELIHLGDIGELPNVVQTLANNLATQNQRVWLLYVVGNDLKDARAIPLIQPLLSSNNESLREAATQALWHIANPAALPSLTRALADPDAQVRFYAVRGCADIANEAGWGGPSEEEFREHEQQYLRHWEDWLKSSVPD